ncbi:MAG: preprotein translocase subunit YajC [bacterium]
MLLSRKAKYWALALVIGIQAVRSPAFAQAQGAAQQGGPAQTFSFFLPLLLVFGIFYFLIIRPQQKQAKKHQEMLKNIQKGDQVVTVGGIHGKVVGVADSILTLEIADNVKIKVERSGVQSMKAEKAEGKGE